MFSPITPAKSGTFWKYGGEPDSDFGNTIRRAVYPTFQLIGEALAQADTQFTLSIQNQPFLVGSMEYEGKLMSGIQAQAIGEKAAEHLVVLVSNRTREHHTPQLFIDGKRYKGSVTYRYVANEKTQCNERRQCRNGGIR